MIFTLTLVGNLKGLREAKDAFARRRLCRTIAGVSVVTPTQLSIFVRFPQMDCGTLST